MHDITVTPVKKFGIFVKKMKVSLSKAYYLSSLFDDSLLFQKQEKNKIIVSSHGIICLVIFYVFHVNIINCNGMLQENIKRDFVRESELIRRLFFMCLLFGTERIGLTGSGFGIATSQVIARRKCITAAYTDTL